MKRFEWNALVQFATKVYQAAGLEADKAESTARLQVLTDAMGRRTHGLAMLPLYLKEIANGTMSKSGEMQVVQDNGHVAVWDGNYLPGLWVIEQAIKLAMPRAAQFGISAVSVRKSHHIGCLAALGKLAADEGLVAMIVNSDPAGERVAPYGGTQAVFTPNPFAFAYPTASNPVLVDVCASITTTSMTREKFAAGEQFEHAWLLDAQGHPTTDPAVLENTNPRGSLQLIGGQEYGHKGFGLALMVETLSQGLSGYGRNAPAKRWGGSTFLQVIDPKLFAGAQAFASQADTLAERCRSNRPIDSAKPVRMPGDQAEAGIQLARTEGIKFADAAWRAIESAGLDLGVSLAAWE